MLSSRIIFIFETEGVINDLMILGNHYSTLALGHSGSKGFRLHVWTGARVPSRLGRAGSGRAVVRLHRFGLWTGKKESERKNGRKSRRQAEEVLKT